jgi:hypothetical protein
MNRYDFYEDFINAHKIRLKELFNELHTSYEIRKDLYQTIKEHEMLLTVVGVNFSSFESSMFVPNNKMILSKSTRVKLPNYIVKIVDMFVYLNNKKIPSIKHELDIVVMCCSMPQRIYHIMQYNANKEIANSILRGGTYNFGKGLSKLGISYVKRSPNAKPVPDWGESNKLKAKLIQLGHKIKSAENPNGIKWLLFRTDDGYCFWKWLKKESFTPNRKIYKFKAIATNNECTDYGKGVTQEQILDKPIGTFDKMMALLKLNPLIINNYEF